MKKNIVKIMIHPMFIFLIFIFVARLASYIQLYRKTIVNADGLEVSILSTIVIVVGLSIFYGVMIGKTFRSRRVLSEKTIDPIEK